MALMRMEICLKLCIDEAAARTLDARAEACAKAQIRKVAVCKSSLLRAFLRKNTKKS